MTATHSVGNYIAGSYIAVVVIKFTVVLAVAILADMVLRRRWPLQVSAMWNCVLVAIAALPLAVALVPATVVPLLSPLPIGTGSPNIVTISSTDSRQVDTPHLRQTYDDRELHVDPADTMDSTAPDERASASESNSLGQIALAAIGVIYLLGVFVALARLTASWLAVRRLRRQAVAVGDPTWRTSFDRWRGRLFADGLTLPILGRIGLNHSRAAAVELLQSNQVHVPIAIGIWRGAVVLPDEMIGGTAAKSCDAIVSHELAHLAREDGFWQLVQRAIAALWWWHPLMWVASSRMTFARERACDEFALYATGDFDLYAQTLIEVASKVKRDGVLGLESSMVRSSKLAARLKSLGEGSSRFAASAKFRAALWIVSFACTLSLASLAVGRGAAAEVVGDESTGPANETEKQATGTAQMTLEQVMGELNKSLKAVESFDIYLTKTMTYRMKSVVVDLKEIKQPGYTKTFDWVPLEPGKTPKTVTDQFRQVWSADGQRRIEIEHGGPPGGKTEGVDDGATMRGFNVRADRVEGSVRKSDPMLQPNEDYLTYLQATISGRLSLVDLIGQRPNTRLIEAGDAEAGLVGLLLPAEGPSLKQIEYRVWLDPAHRFAPNRIDAYFRESPNAAPVLESQTTVERFHEPTPGVWVPVEVTAKSYNRHPGPYVGRVVNDCRLVVDVKRSNWNTKLDDDVFVLRFPQGTTVTDMMNSLQFVAPEGDDGGDIQALAARATKRIPIRTGPPPRLDLAKVRAKDLAAATELLKYRAEMKVDEDGAVTEVLFEGLIRGEPGLTRRLIDDSVVAHVAGFDKLHQLGLNHSEVTDDGLKHLAGLSNLSILSLDCTRITDDGLKHLAPLSNLEWLFLDNNFVRDGERVQFLKITDAGLANLAPLKNLTHLMVRGTDITDAGLEHLKALPKIRQVSVNDTAVTPEGIKRIKAAVPSLRYVLH